MSLREIGRNSVWNLFGQVAPILLAIIVIPKLITSLGHDRYGFLTIVWVLIGYVGIFDLGVGRAMTRVVAERLGAQDREGAEAVAQTAMKFLFLLGLLSATIFLLFANILVGLLGVPDALRDEGINAIRILSIGLPFVMLTSGYRGCLEAYAKFPALNMIRAGMGVFTYVAPLLAVSFSPRLEVMVGSVVLMRLVANWVHRWACIRECGIVLSFRKIDRTRLKQLLGLGGWMTVSNIVGPLMSDLDRLVVGTLVPVATVGYYATAFDVVNQVILMPYSITSAAFPVIAGYQNQEQARSLYGFVVKCVVVTVLPILLLVIGFAHPVFTLWLGTDFGSAAAPVAQIIAVGLFFNCLAQTPVMMIMSRGNPKWIAFNHMIELPLFILLLYTLTKEFGIIGTAVAWSTRATIDAVVLFTLVEVKIVRRSLPLRTIGVTLVLSLVGFALAFTAPSGFLSVGYMALTLALLLVSFWFGLLDGEERPRLMNLVLRRGGATQ